MDRVTRSLSLRVLVVAIVATVGLLLGAGVASAAAPKALIDDATVYGGATSQEATILTADGYAVTVVSDATWGSMTAADFGQYDLLVAGDPACGTLPPGLVSSASVYGPVVLGAAGGRTSAGNRILVGTDPVFHDGGDYTSPDARGTIIRDGLAFAGKQPGTTGMYFDSTCGANYYGQSAETLAIATALSAGSGSWSIDANPPCGGNVSLIASNPSFSDLTTASLEGWGCSVHESFPTFPSDWSALAVATDTPSHPTCGVDPGTGASACGEAYVLVAGSGIVVSSGSISVTPLDSTNPVGTDHTVTANTTSSGSPLSGQTVTFSVTGQNAGATGTCVPADCTTDASGNVSFTYHDANGAGDDTIKASFTDARGSLQSATAQKHWVGAVEQPISASGSPVSATEGTAFSGQVATFTDPASSATASEYSASIDWGDGGSAVAGTIKQNTDGSFSVTGSHTYADEGSSPITVTITDVDNSANGATTTGSASIADASLSATGGTLSSLSTGSVSGTTATFTDANTSSTTADFTATIDWGDGNTSSGTVSGSGGSYSVHGSHTYTTTGKFTIKTHIADDGGSTADAQTNTVLVYALTKGGNFVIGSTKAALNTSVTFWSSNWRTVNSLPSAPSQMKGFEDSAAAPSCGTTWKTNPGNSAPPPAAPLPAYMAVIASSSVSSSGSVITGNTVKVVVVKTNPGYAPTVSGTGTGTVVATICP